VSVVYWHSILLVANYLKGTGVLCAQRSGPACVVCTDCKKVFVVSFRSDMMLIGVGNPGGWSCVCGFRV